MTTAVSETPIALRRGERSNTARRAMTRWAWRMFRREWRRQTLVLAALALAVAATTVGLGVASNATNLKADPVFGKANTMLSLNGSDPELGADVAAAGHWFGTADVISHQSLNVPGSVSTVDVRAEDPRGPYVSPTVRLDAGRFPTGAGEGAVTKEVAAMFGLHLGSAWNVNGQAVSVVGLVENPLDLLDQFALLPSGQLSQPASVTLLVNSTRAHIRSFRLPSGTGLSIAGRGTAGKTAAAVIILVLGSLCLTFVGLMAVAGFTVMAQRRLRSLGMLGSIGATDRHVRVVLLADGAAVGATAALLGTAVGLVAWFAFVPTLQSITGHRVDRFAMPWWAVGMTMLLALTTAVAAAWWPARQVTRVPIVAALSGRPPRPQPAHRFAALGATLLAVGIVLLAFSHHDRKAFIIVGAISSAIGSLLFAPLAIRVLAAAGRHAPISVRLALRDLVRYQARSGAALGSITLAIAIAATIAISAAAAHTSTGVGNLPSDELMVYLAHDAGNPVPPLSEAQQQVAANQVNEMGTAVRAKSVVPLEEAYDPQGSQQALFGPGGQLSGYATAALARVIQRPRGEDISQVDPLYLATPAVLAHYGIRTGDVNSGTDVISGRRNLNGLKIFQPDLGEPTRKAAGTGPAGGRPPNTATPTIQTFGQLPAYTSAPDVLLTEHAMRALGLQPITSGWLIEADHPLTAGQINQVRKAAATVGLSIEARKSQSTSAALRNWATVAGILLALAVLGMTVGLIRSETGNDLRILAATGASSRTRRALTSSTAGALALLGAVLGTGGAYAALLAWHRSDLSPLGRVPVTNLVVILVGLPVIAAVGGWLLAGREPPVLSSTP